MKIILLDTPNIVLRPTIGLPDSNGPAVNDVLISFRTYVSSDNLTFIIKLFDDSTFFLFNRTKIWNYFPVCNLLQADEGLGAVFGVGKSATIPVVESIVTNFGMTYITTSWSPPNNQEDRYIFNVFPHADLFAKALADIVKNHQWTNFAILYETEEGLARMQQILNLQEYQNNVKKNKIVIKQLGTGPDYR